MVFYGLYQPNLDENIGSVAWGINCTDINGYVYGSLPTTSQVVNSYISERTGIHAILAIL